MTRSCYLFAVSTLCFATLATAQTMQVTAPHFVKNPTIDGHVSGEEQAGAARLTMTLVGGLEKPKYATTVYVFANDGGLYFGYVCDEPAMSSIVHKSAKENGPVFDDDSVQLFLSPAREASKTNYYHFAVNSDGIKYSNRMEDDHAMDGWEAAASRGEKSWEAEIFVPFSAIGGETEAPYWRMNLARERPARTDDKEEMTAWINPGASLHNYKRFGFLQFKPSAATPAAPGVPASASSSTLVNAPSPQPIPVQGGPAPTIAPPRPVITPAK